MTADWMAGSVFDNDREEARSARDQPLRDHWSHPIDCRCSDCLRDELGPQDFGGAA